MVRVIWPESPLDVVPVSNSIQPETPAAPAFGVLRVIEPEEDLAEKPDRREISPPVDPEFGRVSPALCLIAPPTPVSP